jgi:hypothetical protein
VQNSVPYEQLGVATSGATLFRSIGGSVGTAVLGAVFTNRLADALAGAGAAGGAAAANAGSLDASALQRLPPAARDAYLGAFTDALDLVFAAAAGVMFLAFLLAWLLPERPLRTSVRTAGLQQAFAAPEDTDSVREVARERSVLVGREGVIGFLARAAARADVDVSPAGGWLLAGGERRHGRRREARRRARRRRGAPARGVPRPAPPRAAHRRAGRHDRADARRGRGGRRAGGRALRGARGPRGGLVAGRAPRARPVRRVAVRRPGDRRAALVVLPAVVGTRVIGGRPPAAECGRQRLK